MDKYSWSFQRGEDIYRDSAASIEDCIKDAVDALKGMPMEKVIYIGENMPHVPVIDVDLLIDGVIENAYDDCGVVSEDWLSHITAEQRESLQAKVQDVFDKWLIEINEPPTFYSVIDVLPFNLHTKPAYCRRPPAAPPASAPPVTPLAAGGKQVPEPPPAEEPDYNLLPCPYCGGKAMYAGIIAYAMFQGKEDKSRPTYEICCSMCPAMMRYTDKQELVAAWNRRYTDGR